MLTIESTISGIPCLIDLYSYEYDKVTNSFYLLDWVVCDRKGYSAKWLANKMTAVDILRIQSELCAAIRGNK